MTGGSQAEDRLLAQTRPEISEYEFESPKLDERGVVIDRRRLAAQIHAQPLPDGSKLDMVLIGAGMYQMGSSPRGNNGEELPLHFVTLAPFMLGVFPITQSQWRAVMGKLPPCRFAGDLLPVERVSWSLAQEFCESLSILANRTYRLPSEAEWEYACRAGTRTPFAFGETLTTNFANYVGEHTFAAEPKGIYRQATTGSGAFPPNEFGLFDMHGNVWEWCQDSWLPDYSSAPRDGAAFQDRRSNPKVVRGGSWHEPPQNCRSASRMSFEKDQAEEFIGLRVAADAPNMKEGKQ